MNRELAKHQESNAGKRKIVAELESQVAPGRDKETSLRAYYEELRAIEIEAEKKSLAREQEEKPEQQVRTTHKKPEADPRRKLQITLKKKGLE